MSEKIIDFHCHIFPQKVAPRAVGETGRYYGIEMAASGLPDDLLTRGSGIGTKKYIVHSTATRADQVSAINDYVAGQCAEHPEFVGFGTLHPGLSNHEAEVSRLTSMGLRGIKLHPEFQNFNLDDEAMFPLYSAVGKLPLLIHTGDKNRDNSSPDRLLRVLDRFPDLVVIGAHFGGYSIWDKACATLAGSGIYVDTSSSLFAIEPEKAMELIDTFGSDRVLFGTDFPMWDPKEELERFNRLPLTDTVRGMILYGNAAALLGMEEEQK